MRPLRKPLAILALCAAMVLGCAGADPGPVGEPHAGPSASGHDEPALPNAAQPTNADGAVPMDLTNKQLLYAAMARHTARRMMSGKQPGIVLDGVDYEFGSTREAPNGGPFATAVDRAHYIRTAEPKDKPPMLIDFELSWDGSDFEVVSVERVSDPPWTYDKQGEYHTRVMP